MVFGMGSKLLSHKVSQHEQNVALAKAKANTIRDLVSKALQHSAISNQEFSRILAEADKFEKLKYEIRQKTKKKSRYVTDKKGGSSGDFKGVNRSRTLKLSFEISLRKERC